jgi:hypothetical protein
VGSTTTITNVEAVTNLSVATAASVVTVPCAPAFTGLWLGALAANWGKWRWKKLRFLYIPICPTSTQGSVHFAFQYDSWDTAPSNVFQISAMSHYTTGPVWSGFQAAPCLSHYEGKCPEGSIVADLDISRNDKRYYPFVTLADYNTLVAATIQLGNMYSPAKLQVLTADGTATVTACGRLYVMYEVEVFEPLIPNLNP